MKASVGAVIKCHGVIHGRPCAKVICRLQKEYFPKTPVFVRAAEGELDSAVPLDSIIKLWNADFHDGDNIVIEVDGPDAPVVAEIFKVAFENLWDPEQAEMEHYEVEYEKVWEIVLGKIDEAVPRMSDEMLIPSPASEVSANAPTQLLAYLNDRLHNLTVPILPAVAGSFDCIVELRFETNSGIHVCKLDHDNDAAVDEMLCAAPPAGTRITIVASGEEGDAAARTLQRILSHLRECDAWLRPRIRQMTEIECVKGLLCFLEKIEGIHTRGADSDSGVRLSTHVTEDKTLVYLPSSSLSMGEVLHQLVALQTVHHLALNEDEILKVVWDREQHDPVIIKEGIAIPHAPIDHGPRLSVSVAVVPHGVEWEKYRHPVSLIFLFLYSSDTHRTYLEHVGQLAAIFRSDTSFQNDLMSAKHSRDVVQIIRNAEDAMEERLRRRDVSLG